MEKEFVIGLDVGTTTVRSFLYNGKGEICGTGSVKVETLFPKPGWEEIDPDNLWNKVLLVLKGCMNEAGVTSKDIASLGISCQRATFTCWSRATSRHFHNFITWKDCRADSLVKQWNDSFSLKSLRAAGKMLHSVTGVTRFKAAGIYTMYNKLITLRLQWCLDNIPSLRNAASKGDVMFGCVDTWLLYKLTGTHLAEVSNMAATGLFDPFTMDYAGWVFTLFNIPFCIMPEIVDSCGPHYGTTLPDILGSPVPVTAVLADQSASVFGSGCYTSGSAKITLGTGSFLDVVSHKAHASMTGLIPIVGWRIEKEVVHLTEGQVLAIGGMLDWARSVDLFTDFDTLSESVEKVEDSGGVYFIPGFYGLQAPVSDPSATAGFIGIGPKTKKAHMLRALLESIGFSQRQLVDNFRNESSLSLDTLVVDGGVAKNDFILQLISNLTGLSVFRPDSVEMSAWGAAALSGLQIGLWKSREELRSLQSQGKTFNPAHSNRLEDDYRRWQAACTRFTKWNQTAAF